MMFLQTEDGGWGVQLDRRGLAVGAGGRRPRAGWLYLVGSDGPFGLGGPKLVLLAWRDFRAPLVTVRWPARVWPHAPLNAGGQR